jgi:hypothetical protein
MIDILNDIEILENAIIAFKEGASDEKEMAMNSLEKLLAEKKAIMVAFEKEMAPDVFDGQKNQFEKGHQVEVIKEPFQRWK